MVKSQPSHHQEAPRANQPMIEQDRKIYSEIAMYSTTYAAEKSVSCGAFEIFENVFFENEYALKSIFEKRKRKPIQFRPLHLKSSLN